MPEGVPRKPVAARVSPCIRGAPKRPWAGPALQWEWRERDPAVGAPGVNPTLYPVAVPIVPDSTGPYRLTTSPCEAFHVGLGAGFSCPRSAR
ncbi:hypothetical protein GCM10010145_39070 [Streptomyces ruber]|uniref:Uncharacterized protein n=2 Tax=Streptomyces TaxID=1883 RepID=A0A918EU72_9ACTN|nr:hypothetical protein GCM10010145_39070 [Streptomyces ruber]